MKYRSIIISIGNEILLGRTLNSNLGYLGVELSRLGFPVHRCISIKDEPDEILRALHEAWTDSDVVITTGGLGPTQDDITRLALAEYFGKALVLDEAVWEGIQALFRRRNSPIPISNQNQAMVPQDFQVLPNDRGTAPGLHYHQDGRHIFALQGVPHEMKHLFAGQIKGILKAAFPSAEELLQRDLHTFNIGESALAEIIHAEDMPSGITLAWLPQAGRVDLRIYGTDALAMTQAEEVIVSKAGRYIWGRDADAPPQCLVQMLKQLNLSIAIAESCTGGLVQKYLTDIAGVSDVFLGGVVSYHNSAKEALLQVSPQILDEHGAVSRECAQAMAQGVQKSFGSDLAISVTGIAGPDGGSDAKPVGTVHFGFRIGNRGFEEHKLLFGDRESIRHKAAEMAILTLLKMLKEASK